MNATRKKVNSYLVFPIILIIVLLTQMACIPGSKHLNIIINLERKNLSKASLLIFNFREPAHAEGFGSYIAERFHVNLLQAKIFRVVGIHDASPWSRLGATEEDRLLNALDECREKNFDYIMVGEIRDFYEGGINQSRLSIKIRIIETSTKITIFLAEHSLTSTGKDPSYPMTTKLSKHSLPPKTLAEKLIEEIIKVM